MLTIHFFTIVYNGCPFIEHHIEVFKKLSANWHWHIVEGAADLKHDTAWSVHSGGRVPGADKKITLSIDGTTECLDDLAKNHPDRISIYRKPQGVLWDGKLEMVRAPLANIQEECLLWQIDVDEFWTADQIETICSEFDNNPEKTAAWYWCNYFVGPDITISTRNCYAQNPSQEWLRTWRYLPGDCWAAHEPPMLLRKGVNGVEEDLGRLNPISHRRTEELGAEFEHHAYLLESQVAFKEQYYGYAGAIDGWRALQVDASSETPLLLSKYFSWVKDSTYVMRESESHTVQECQAVMPMVLVDGVVYQLKSMKGIARVWTSIMREWVEMGLSKYITVLDRDNTCPEISGINRIPFQKWDELSASLDCLQIEGACRRTCSQVFVSTLFTSSVETPSVFLHHDFIPERVGSILKGNLWSERIRAMKHAVRHICVSHNTKKDLLAIHPDIKEETIFASSLGVGGSLHKCQTADIETFKREYGLHKPYLLFVGDRIGLAGAGQPGEGYKNGKIFLDAFKKWKSSTTHMLLFIGGAKDIEQSILDNCDGIQWKHLCPDDEELARAYGGALAMVYPSKYEGFGLPVAEAMKCGCPVIASRTSSLPEVGGDAPIYIDPESVDELVDAMDKVLDSEYRQKMIERGISQATGMTWRKIAEDVWGELIRATEGSPGDAIPWRSVRSELAELEVIRNEATCVKNSLSWKVTYPLRAFSRRLCQFLGKQYRDL